MLDRGKPWERVGDKMCVYVHVHVCVCVIQAVTLCISFITASGWTTAQNLWDCRHDSNPSLLTFLSKFTALLLPASQGHAITPGWPVVHPPKSNVTCIQSGNSAKTCCPSCSLTVSNGGERNDPQPLRNAQTWSRCHCISWHLMHAINVLLPTCD